MIDENSLKEFNDIEKLIDLIKDKYKDAKKYVNDKDKYLKEMNDDILESYMYKIERSLYDSFNMIDRILIPAYKEMGYSAVNFVNDIKDYKYDTMIHRNLIHSIKVLYLSIIEVEPTITKSSDNVNETEDLVGYSEIEREYYTEFFNFFNVAICRNYKKLVFNDSDILKNLLLDLAKIFDEKGVYFKSSFINNKDKVIELTENVFNKYISLATEAEEYKGEDNK